MILKSYGLFSFVLSESIAAEKYDQNEFYIIDQSYAILFTASVRRETLRAALFLW